MWELFKGVPDSYAGSTSAKAVNSQRLKTSVVIKERNPLKGQNHAAHDVTPSLLGLTQGTIIQYTKPDMWNKTGGTDIEKEEIEEDCASQKSKTTGRC
jgi:hypothetical protein